MKVKAKEKKKNCRSIFSIEALKALQKNKKTKNKNYRREGISSKFNELHFAAKILRAW